MINKLYQKSELCFSIIWIITYVVFASIGDNISTSIGILKIITLPILLVISIGLFIFITKNKLSKKYGLCKPEIPSSKMLYYIPLLILLTVNLWYGVSFNFTLIETILYISSMICVGFIEEIIFRGLLFNAIAKDSIKMAIIISSITFGIGHIVNLINGSNAQILETLLQVIYAIVTGFTFVMIYYKTKSLLPCIFTHCIFNSLSAFSNDAILTPKNQIISSILIIIITGSYALYIVLTLKEHKIKKTNE